MKSVVNSNIGRWFLVSLLVLVILVLRNPNLFLMPVLYNEDGWFLSKVYNNPSLSTIFSFHNGYTCFLPVLLIYLINFLDIETVPYVINCCGYVLTALFIGSFSMGWMKSLAGSPTQRVWLCIIIAMLPLENAFLISAIVYKIWHCLLILVVSTLISLPRGRWKILQFLICSLLAISNPLSVLVAPVAAYLIYEGRGGTRYYYGLLVVIIVLFQVTSVDHGAVNLSSVLSAVVYTFKFIADRVFFELLFGAYFRLKLYSMNLDALVTGTGVLLMVASSVVMIAWRKQLNKRFLSLAVYYVGGISFLTVLSRGTGELFLHLHCRRYSLVPKLLVVLVFFYLARALLGSNRRWRRILPYLLVVWITVLNLWNNRFYSHGVVTEEHRYLKQFFSEVKKRELEGRVLQIERPTMSNSTWSYTLKR